MTNPLHIIFGEPPTPEQRVADAKKLEAQITTALEHLRSAQGSLREVAIVGIDPGGRVTTVRHAVASMIDDCEVALRGGLKP